jgi:hypothetical protein
MEQDQPPRRSLHLLKLPPHLDPLPKLPSKRHRVNKHGTYISTSQTHDHPVMSTESDPNISGSPSTPFSSVISGIPSTPSSSMVWVSEVPSSSATQPVSSTRPTGMNPFRSLFGMSSHDSQSIPSASNPFSFGMPDMTSQLSSSISTTNVNPSFGSGGTTPPYVPFSFGGGHIPQEILQLEVGILFPPGLILASMLWDGVLKWVDNSLPIFHPSSPLPPRQFQ